MRTCGQAQDFRCISSRLHSLQKGEKKKEGKEKKREKKRRSTRRSRDIQESRNPTRSPDFLHLLQRARGSRYQVRTVPLTSSSEKPQFQFQGLFGEDGSFFQVGSRYHWTVHSRASAQKCRSTTLQDTGRKLYPWNPMNPTTERKSIPTSATQYLHRQMSEAKNKGLKERPEKKKE